jgi:hypothetical protein
MSETFRDKIEINLTVNGERALMPAVNTAFVGRVQFVSMATPCAVV